MVSFMILLLITIICGICIALCLSIKRMGRGPATPIMDETLEDKTLIRNSNAQNKKRSNPFYTPDDHIEENKDSFDEEDSPSPDSYFH